MWAHRFSRQITQEGANPPAFELDQKASDGEAGSDDDSDDPDEALDAAPPTTTTTATDEAFTTRRRLRKAAKLAPVGRSDGPARPHGKQAVGTSAGKRSAEAQPGGKRQGEKRARRIAPTPTPKQMIPTSAG